MQKLFLPLYIKPDLKWYERDGLMTYCDRLAYDRFEENRDSYLKNVRVINFDIINHQIRNSPLQKSIKEYKTVKNEQFDNMPPDDKDAAVAAVFRCSRSDLEICKDVRDEYFKEWEESKKFVKDRQNLKNKNQKYFESW